eukprot:1176032-Prorocentrum_minimum.AAC.4
MMISRVAEEDFPQRSSACHLPEVERLHDGFCHHDLSCQVYSPPSNRLSSHATPPRFPARLSPSCRSCELSRRTYFWSHSFRVGHHLRANRRAGIRVFVTGGIGGVHRGGETTMDISADLTGAAQP